MADVVVALQPMPDGQDTDQPVAGENPAITRKRIVSVGVAKRSKASGCNPEDREFESRSPLHPPPLRSSVGRALAR